MAGSASRLSGEDWQNWANRILSVHYGPTEYQQIPDNDRGDAGLEGFTRTNGHAYQAYGCEEPISASDRYEKQRNKMTRDVAKFIDNQATLNRIFGNVKITRWVLFVPYCGTNEIVAHAAKKTEEVIAANLPFVSNAFQVCMCQQTDFAIADRQLVNATHNSIAISIETPTPEQIIAWADANQTESSALSEKLSRLPTLTSEKTRAEFQSRVLDWYLRGQEVLEALREYPETYAKVKAAKSHRESFLLLGRALGRSPQVHLEQSINQVRDDFEQEVKELHRFSSESLAFEAAADWLLRCPLDFPEAHHE